MDLILSILTGLAETGGVISEIRGRGMNLATGGLGMLVGKRAA